VTEEHQMVQDLPYTVRKCMYDAAKEIDFVELKEELIKARKEHKDCGAFMFQNDNGVNIATDGEKIAFFTGTLTFNDQGESERKILTCNIPVAELEGLLIPNNPEHDEIITLIKEEPNG